MDRGRHIGLLLSVSGALALLAAAPQPAASPAAGTVLSDIKNATAVLSPQGFVVNGSVLVPNLCWRGAIRPAPSTPQTPHAFQVVRTYAPPAKSDACTDISAYVYVPSVTVKDPHPPKTITLVTSQGDRTISVTPKPPV